jgi:hypothetical protein
MARSAVAELYEKYLTTLIAEEKQLRLLCKERDAVATRSNGATNAVLARNAQLIERLDIHIRHYQAQVQTYSALVQALVAK